MFFVCCIMVICLASSPLRKLSFDCPKRHQLFHYCVLLFSLEPRAEIIIVGFVKSDYICCQLNSVFVTTIQF